MKLITLTTDFGHTDAYVGVMHGVIAGIAPQARIIDLCHGIAPQNITAAALVLEQAVDTFPPGTIHVCVVDPGVGGARAAIAVRAQRHCYIAPDNGVLTAALERDPPRAIVSLTQTAYHRTPTSHTFHGRDIFSPCAAHLAAGVSLHELGTAQHDIVRLPLRRVQAGVAHVIHIDHFGNLITSATAEDLPASPVFRVRSLLIHGLANTFSEAARREPIAYVGSTGRIELALREGNLAQQIHAAEGDEVRLS